LGGTGIKDQGKKTFDPKNHHLLNLGKSPYILLYTKTGRYTLIKFLDNRVIIIVAL